MSPNVKKSEMAKTYLVTGGAGFIGSHLVDRLLTDGHRVVVLDDFSLGKKENLPKHKNLKIYKKSICDNLVAIFKKYKFDAVFHLAALPRVQFSIAYPRESHEANINGTLNLLLAAKKFDVKRFVYSSSSSVYGNQAIMPLVETMPAKPISPYALQKYVGEEYCRLFHLLYDMETISLRYFNVYGARQNPDGAYAGQIPKFFSKLLRGETPVINGDGTQTRDNTYVADVVEANILAGKRVSDTLFGKAFNIGGGQNTSVNETTQRILKLTGSKIKPTHGPAVIEPHDTLADTTKAKKILGWEPKTSYEDGLQATYEYFKKTKL